MDRKEFLKSACGLGVCGCALGLLGTTAPLSAAEASAEEQRLAFVRYQLARLLGFMATDAPADVSAGILEKTGRECARLGQLGAKFKESFAAVFGKPVQARLKESKLTGAKRCVFEVAVS